MILAVTSLDPPVPRLLATVAGRSFDDRPPHTLVLGAGTESVEASLAKAPGARLLVMSTLGVHPDARAPRLRALWDLEEQARASGRPVLTLRLAPLVGASSPLWLKLRSRPNLPEAGHTLLNPVTEDDVVETLARALDGRAAWEGWYEVAGPEVLALEELAALAARTPRVPPDAGQWEPPPAELREHRLAESAPWLEHFSLTPSEVSSRATGWS